MPSTRSVNYCFRRASLTQEERAAFETRLAQARDSVEGLIDNLGPDGLPMVCVRDIFQQLVSESKHFTFKHCQRLGLPHQSNAF